MTHSYYSRVLVFALLHSAKLPTIKVENFRYNENLCVLLFPRKRIRGAIAIFRKIDTYGKKPYVLSNLYTYEK